MGSRSKSSTEQTTHVTTHTTTNIRDIGFTGQQAVDLAAILEGGAIDRAQVNADTVRVMTSELGSSFKTLMGGAGDIFQEAGWGIAEAGRGQAASFDTLMTGAKDMFKEAGRGMVETARIAGAPEPKANYLPFIALAIVGFIVLKKVT